MEEDEEGEVDGVEEDEEEEEEMFDSGGSWRGWWI